MNIRDDDRVSAVALVVESEAQTAAKVLENGTGGPAAAQPAEVGENSAEDDGAATDSAGSDQA
jgi:hypothetical protein